MRRSYDSRPLAGILPATTGPGLPTDRVTVAPASATNRMSGRRDGRGLRSYRIDASLGFCVRPRALARNRADAFTNAAGFAVMASSQASDSTAGSEMALARDRPYATPTSRIERTAGSAVQGTHPLDG